jgi:dihydrodipicolinate synthase/N-acetylneuraminate lyase
LFYADPLIVNKLRSGCVIPAHPLALQNDNRIDERYQRALTRYYLSAGAGGLAVGVHTTQFAIHNPKIGLYRPVLELAIETARQFTAPAARGEPIMIAGIVGDTKQAMEEAHLARRLGYHIGLLSLTALKGKSIDELIDHSRRAADVIPIMGFYLQQTISKMTLPAEFWQKFVTIPNVLAVKIAPFNRYQTLDVLEAVARSAGPMRSHIPATTTISSWICSPGTIQHRRPAGFASYRGRLCWDSGHAGRKSREHLETD